MASKQIQIPIREDFNLPGALEMAKSRLMAEGYEVMVQAYSPQSGKMVVTKDMDGIKQFIGLGVQCDINFVIMNGTMLSATIESTWTNKIIALAVGWFLCWVPFITGIIGCSNQSKLPKKIEDTVQGVVMTTGQDYGPGFNPNPVPGINPGFNPDPNAGYNPGFNPDPNAGYNPNQDFNSNQG